MSVMVLWIINYVLYILLKKKKKNYVLYINDDGPRLNKKNIESLQHLPVGINIIKAYFERCNFHICRCCIGGKNYE